MQIYEGEKLLATIDVLQSPKAKMNCHPHQFENQIIKPQQWSKLHSRRDGILDCS